MIDLLFLAAIHIWLNSVKPTIQYSPTRIC